MDHKWFLSPPLLNEVVPLHVFMGFMALITAVVLCASSQDSLLSVSMSRVHVVFSIAIFKGGGKPWHTFAVTSNR